jgi:flagellar basal body rod protein FlgG
MAFMVDFSAPLLGLERATTSLDKTAAKVATQAFSEGDSLEFGPEMVALMQARRSFEANTSVIRTENEVSKSVLNILA